MTGRSGATARGFTLVELMVVVAIVGVLAVLGVMVLSKHNRHARTHETLAMMQSIRVAQERWRAENLTYLNVSQSALWFPRNPTDGDGNVRVTFLQAVSSHADGANWALLNPTSNPFVYGGYRCNAGMPGATMTAVDVPDVVWPVPAESWYVIQATVDTDDDGITGFYAASSLNGEVYRRDEAE